MSRNIPATPLPMDCSFPVTYQYTLLAYYVAHFYIHIRRFVSVCTISGNFILSFQLGGMAKTKMGQIEIVHTICAVCTSEYCISHTYIQFGNEMK